MASEDKKTTPKQVFTKTVLSDRILLTKEDLAIEIRVGGWSKFRNGKAEIGVSFGDINEKKIRRKNRSAKEPMAANALDKFIDVRRNEILGAYKQETLDKLKEVGLDKDTLSTAEKELKTKDIEFLLH